MWGRKICYFYNVGLMFIKLANFEYINKDYSYQLWNMIITTRLDYHIIDVSVIQNNRIQIIVIIRVRITFWPKMKYLWPTL